MARLKVNLRLSSIKFMILVNESILLVTKITNFHPLIV